MDSFLSDVSFLRNAFSHLGWSESEFPVGIVTSILVLVASACVCGKYAFKTTHTVLWTIYWTVVISFRVVCWMFVPKAKPLTNIEDLVTHLANRGQVKEESQFPVLVCENLRIMKSNSLLEVFVGGKSVLDRISPSVKAGLHKIYDQKVTAFQAAKRDKEDQEILSILSRPMLVENGRKINAGTSSGHAEMLVLRSPNAEKGSA